MGRKSAEKPLLLAGKLKKARLLLRFTQEQMHQSIKEAGADIHLGYVSLFETGQRVPSLLTLLAYSRVSGIAMEVFVDDGLEMTENLLK